MPYKPIERNSFSSSPSTRDDGPEQMDYLCEGGEKRREEWKNKAIHGELFHQEEISSHKPKPKNVGNKAKTVVGPKPYWQHRKYRKPRVSK